jgi:hypothetical protein
MKQVTHNNKRSKKIQNADKDGLWGWFLFLFSGWLVFLQGVTVVDRVLWGCGGVICFGDGGYLFW